jgi:hypothetical protein
MTLSIEGPASYQALLKLQRAIAGFRRYNKRHWFEGGLTSDLLDEKLVLAITNTFLQAVSVFDDLLGDYMARYHPGAKLPLLHNRLEYLTKGAS